MKAKEWLLANGHIQAITRGRISSANKALIEDAVRKGAKIEGYSVSTAPVKADTPQVVSKVATTTEKTIADLPPYRYPEDEFVAFERDNGKKVTRSLRCACNKCRQSLVVCWCEEPAIVARDGRGSVRVYIERK